MACKQCRLGMSACRQALQNQAHGFESLLDAEDSLTCSERIQTGLRALQCCEEAFNEWMLSACEKYGKARQTPMQGSACRFQKD